MYKKILTFSFVGFFAFFLLLLLITPDVEFSENENMSLQTMPQLSLEGVISGKFMTEFEEYVKDQFPFRDEFIALKAGIELISGKMGNNGVFLTKDNYMFTDIDPVDEERLSKNIDVVKQFAEKNSDIPVTTVVVPTQSMLLRDKLPSFVYFRDSLSVYERLKEELPGFLDLLPKMEELAAQEDIFFHTDHHWNSKGAYLGYSVLMDALQKEALEEDAYQKTVSEEPFRGTMTSKSGFYFKPGDTLELWDSGMKKKLYIEDGGTTVEYDSVFFPENLTIKDQYTAFLGGNKPIHRIVNEQAPYKEKVLVLKDSYAHILAPFLSDSFSEVTLVDLRYVKMSMSNYIEEQGFDRVIILYSISEFISSVDLGLLR